jgi:hypothetical protein
MLHRRGRQLALIATTAVIAVFAGGCCCNDVLEKILEKYDYVKGIVCVTSGKVKGCITIEQQGHVEIEVEHRVSIEEACRYTGNNTSPRMNVAFRHAEDIATLDPVVCFDFNGDAISFDHDPIGEAELEAHFGGTWSAFLARTEVFPTLNDSLMDNFHFSYRLTFQGPFPLAQGMQDISYDLAVKDPDTGIWHNSPTTRRLEYDTVIITFSDPRAIEFPFEILPGQTLTIPRVFAMLKNDSPLHVDAYRIISQGGAEISRQLLISPTLPPNNVLGPYILSWPTAALAPGLYTATVEVTAFGQPNDVLGSKSVPFRVE